MNDKNLSDEEVINLLQSGDAKKVDFVLSFLHIQLFTKVSHYIRRKKGSFNDAEDIFQDALLALYKLGRLKKIDKSVNIQAYLFSICKNLWHKQFNKAIKMPTQQLDSYQHTIPVEELPLQALFTKEKKEMLTQILSQIGEKCKQLLISFYYHKMPLEQIAVQLSYSNTQVAKNKKVICMKNLKAIILTSASLKDFFN